MRTWDSASVPSFLLATLLDGLLPVSRVEGASLFSPRDLSHSFAAVSWRFVSVREYLQRGRNYAVSDVFRSGLPPSSQQRIPAPPRALTAASGARRTSSVPLSQWTGVVRFPSPAPLLTYRRLPPALFLQTSVRRKSGPSFTFHSFTPLLSTGLDRVWLGLPYCPADSPHSRVTLEF